MGQHSVDCEGSWWISLLLFGQSRKGANSKRVILYFCGYENIRKYFLYDFKSKMLKSWVELSGTVCVLHAQTLG